MSENIEKNSIIERKESFFTKIKNFFKSAFSKDKNIEENAKKIEINKKENFKEDIILQEDLEKIRLLQIQDKFSKKVITADEISDEDKVKIAKLYDEQIEKINQSIQACKKRIEEINLKSKKAGN